MLDINNIPLNDEATWELLAAGKTKGVFQLESHLGCHWSKQMKPKSVHDLGSLTALIRPGCLQVKSGDPPKSMTQHYCDRKNGQEEVTYLHPDLEKVLGQTWSVIVFQENAMRVAKEFAGFDLKQADDLRKAIGKKNAELMSKVKIQFLTGCENVGKITKEQAEEIFGWIQESQRYSFCKAHAIDYGMIAYRTAYLKANYPLQFYCGYLIGAQWKQDPQQEIYELVNDAKSSDIDIRLPTITNPNPHFYIRQDAIYFGIGDVKHIGESALKKINEAITTTSLAINKTVDQWKWVDYLFHCSDNISSTANEALISVGALHYMGMTRTAMLYELGIWSKLSPVEKKWVQAREWNTLLGALRCCQPIKKMGGGCHNQKRSDTLASLIKVVQDPPNSLEDRLDWISWIEEKYLGTAVSCSKVDACRNAIHATHSCKDITKDTRGYIVVAAEVKEAKEITTKKSGQKMAFLTIIGEGGSLDGLPCFPDTWNEAKNILIPGNTVLIQLEKGKGDSHIVKRVWQI